MKEQLLERLRAGRDLGHVVGGKLPDERIHIAHVSKLDGANASFRGLISMGKLPACALPHACELNRVATSAHRADLVHGAGHDDPPRADERHAVACPPDLFEDVRGEQDGGAAFPLLGNQVEKALLHEWIETARGLVEQKHVRARHERSHNRNLLPVALGHPADSRPEVQVEDIDELTHPGAVAHAPHPRHEVKEGTCGHLLHADVLTGQVTQTRLHSRPLPKAVVPENLNRSFLRLDKPHEMAHRHRLPSPVGAEKSERFSCPHLKIDVEDAAAPTVVLREPAHEDRRR